MILTYFSPLPGSRPNTFGETLSRRAWPLETRTPERLSELLKRLERR